MVSSVNLSLMDVDAILTRYSLIYKCNTEDYESDKIDLSDSRVYRDLSKPVGELLFRCSISKMLVLVFRSSSFNTILDVQGL